MTSSRIVKAGFTLIELAIVIVIIGLLVAGVLQGRELIAQAKLRSMMKSIAEYEAAANTFKSKYNMIPGDSNRASVLIGPTAYNGNNDGEIDTYAPAPMASESEILFAWQHLGLAKMIKGNYTGLMDPIKSFSAPGINGPIVQGYQSSAVIHMIYFNPTNLSTAGGTFFGRAGGHVYILGNGELGFPYSGFLTAMEAYQVDVKLDDGNPAKGIVNAGNGINIVGGMLIYEECTTPSAEYIFSNTYSNAYILSSEKKGCVLVKWANI